MKIAGLKQYAKNKTLVTEGFEYKIPDSEVSFTLRQFNSIENAELQKAAIAEYFKPYAKLMQNDKLSSAKQHEINVKVWIKIALVGWKNLLDEETKKPLEFNEKTALELMLGYEDLYLELVNQSKDPANFAEDVGND